IRKPGSFVGSRACWTAARSVGRLLGLRLLGRRLLAGSPLLGRGGLVGGGLLSGSGCRGGVLLGQVGGQRLGSGNLLGLAGVLGGDGGLALASLDLLGPGGGGFKDAGRLAAAIPQVIQLGAPHPAALHHLDAVDVRAEYGENALDAFAIGNLADGEALHDAGAGTGADHALVGLQPFLVALADLHPDLDGVAMGEFGMRAALGESVVLLLVELFDDVHWSVRSD